MATKNSNVVLPVADSFNAKGTGGAMTNMAIPGQEGYIPNYEYWHASAEYVKPPVIPFLMEAPDAFQILDNPSRLVATLKALMEVHARTITGLDQSLEVEFSTTPFGGAGEQMETVAKVKRAQSQPQYDWVERIGKPVTKFWNYYILNILGNPDSNIPAAVSRGQTRPYGLYPDFTSFTMMFVQADRTQKYVDHAWLCSNMMPKSGAKIEGNRDITETPAGVTVSIGFTCLQQVGAGVDRLAQTMLDTANQTGLDPNNRRAWLRAIEADVKSATDSGYKDDMTTAKAQMV